MGRYVRSRKDAQLHKNVNASAVCNPQAFLANDMQNASLLNGGDILPCGLIAWSQFNDTFSAALREPGQTTSANLPIDVCPIVISDFGLPTLLAPRICKYPFSPQPHRLEPVRFSAAPREPGQTTCANLLIDVCPVAIQRPIATDQILAVPTLPSTRICKDSSALRLHRLELVQRHLLGSPLGAWADDQRQPAHQCMPFSNFGICLCRRCSPSESAGIPLPSGPISWSQI